MWTDDILQWNPLDYGYTYRLVVPGDQIWKPEIAMLNSVDEGNDLTLNTNFRYGCNFIVEDVLQTLRHVT